MSSEKKSSSSGKSSPSERSPSGEKFYFYNKDLTKQPNILKPPTDWEALAKKEAKNPTTKNSVIVVQDNFPDGPIDITPEEDAEFKKWLKIYHVESKRLRLLGESEVKMDEAQNKATQLLIKEMEYRKPQN